MKKLKIAYYCSNRTVFPPPNNIVAANAEVMKEIAQGMINKGHQVTIYASKGSKMKGAKIIDLGLPAHQLDPAYEKEEWVKDLHIAYRSAYISQLMADSNKYDLIHLHVGRVIAGQPFLKFSHCPVVFTVHEKIPAQFEKLMTLDKKTNLVSISNSQRKAAPKLNYVSTVYNGIDLKKHTFNNKPGNDCVFINRISKEKGVEFAIKAAKRAKVNLKIYGPGEKSYLNKVVLPFVNEKITYQGMAEKYSAKWHQAYAKAKVILFPIQWEEPFGLVMIEAMACGTPVIAFNRGSVPEIIKDNKTGFICPANDLNSMVRAIKKIYQMPADEYANMRRQCRKLVEEKFSAEKMVNEYEKVYRKLLAK